MMLASNVGRLALGVSITGVVGVLKLTGAVLPPPPQALSRRQKLQRLNNDTDGRNENCVLFILCIKTTLCLLELTLNKTHNMMNYPNIVYYL